MKYRVKITDGRMFVLLVERELTFTFAIIMLSTVRLFVCLSVCNVRAPYLAG